MMEYADKGDVVYFHVAFNDTSGSGADATGPAAFVRQCGAAGGALPITAGVTTTLLSDAGYPDGLYEIAIDTSNAAYVAENVYAVFANGTVDGQTPSGHLAKFRLKTSHRANQETYFDNGAAASALTLDAHMSGQDNDQISYRLGLDRTTDVPSTPGTLDLTRVHIGTNNDASIPLLVTTGAASTQPAFNIKVTSAASPAIVIDSPVGNTANLVQLNHSGSAGLIEYNTTNASTGHAYIYTGVATQYIDDEDQAISPALLSVVPALVGQRVPGELASMPNLATAQADEVLMFLAHYFKTEKDQTDAGVQTIKNEAGSTIGTANITEPVAGTLRRGNFT